MTDKLREALAFYGNMQNWQDGGFTRTARNTMTLIMSTAMKDRGERARAALAAAPQPAPERVTCSVCADLDKLRGALRPFARMADSYSRADDTDHANDVSGAFLVGDFRRAKRVLDALAAAPQPAAVDREALVDVIDNADTPALRRADIAAIADALLARGLRLPGGDETAHEADWRRWKRGEALEVLAKDRGVTRERMRLRLAKMDVNMSQLALIERAERAEAERDAAFAAGQNDAFNRLAEAAGGLFSEDDLAALRSLPIKPRPE